MFILCSSILDIPIKLMEQKTMQIEVFSGFTSSSVKLKCRNLSRFATKARACEGAGQE
jgi:hypothetical protein